MTKPATPKTLLDYVQAHSKSTQLIQSWNMSITADMIAQQVEEFRTQFSSLKGKVVVVSITDYIQCLIALCALDGFSCQITVVPDDLDEAQANDIFFNSDYVLNCNQGNFSVVRQAGTSVAKTKVTTWTLTTSGTSGKPKFISHTLTSLTRSCKTILDITHCWGLMFAPYRFSGLQVFLQSIIAGTSLVIPRQASLGNMLDDLIVCRVTALSATPTMWRQLLMTNRLAQLELSVITLGGEIVDQQLLEQLSTLFPSACIRHIYASTEVGVVLSVRDKKAGFPVAWIGDEVRNPLLKLSHDKHLLVKENSNEPGEFIDTGDIVSISNERVYFQGRENGLINVGGHKVQPEAIECVIRQFDNVADVRVFGQKNSLMGQIVAADIVLKTPIDNNLLFKQQLIAHLKKTLNNYQVPMLLFFKKELSISGANKVIRG